MRAHAGEFLRCLRKAGVPTGYAGSECDPALKSRAGVIDTATALSHWLGQRT